MTMFLSTDEIKNLTGKHQKTAQMRALKHMGIEHKVRPDGALVVLRSHIEKLLDGAVQLIKSDRLLEPNWSALNGTSQKSGKQRTA